MVSRKKQLLASSEKVRTSKVTTSSTSTLSWSPSLKIPFRKLLINRSMTYLSFCPSPNQLFKRSKRKLKSWKSAWLPWTPRRSASMMLSCASKSAWKPTWNQNNYWEMRSTTRRDLYNRCSLARELSWLKDLEAWSDLSLVILPKTISLSWPITRSSLRVWRTRTSVLTTTITAS